MKNSDITDPLFLKAVEAIDAGNFSPLQQLLQKHPELVINRLHYPDGGYFKDPWLLWFVADNPIRHEKLPVNITAITSMLIEYIQRNTPGTFQQQINYTLELVVTGRIPRECGVQIALMDLLIDAGALPGRGHGALANGNLEAAQRLIERGGELTLATAICLERTNDIALLAKDATGADREIALVAAAFYGKAAMIHFIIHLGVDVNAYLDASSGFHWHGTALHQAVSSGSLEAVKELVAAGANLTAKDRIFQGTALGWAEHMRAEENDAGTKKKYAAIETYLRSRL